MIQLIEYQKPVFRLIINGIECKYYPPSTIFIPSQFLPLTTKVKGSTLGWNIKGWVSYNQIKKAIKTTTNEVVVDESKIGTVYELQHLTPVE